MSKRKAKAIAADIAKGKGPVAACRDNGVKHPTHNCTRTINHPEVKRSLAEIEAEHLKAMEQAGLTPLAWATGLKQGVDEGNPAALRLYAEVVKLVGSEKANQVIVLVVQQVAGLVVQYVPEDRRGDLMRDLEGMNAAAITG